MKKIDLVHTTILIVAILAGYSALEYLFYLLTSVVSVADSSYLYKQSSGLFLHYILLILFFAVASIILVRNGRKYAGMMLKNEPEGSWDEADHLHLDRRNVFLVLFIGLGLYTLIQYLPYVLSDLFGLFREKISSNPIESSAKKTPLVVELLRVTIGAFLIYAAPALTDFVIKKIAVRPDSES